MIVSNEPEEAIRKVALASGMVPMYKDGIEKIRQGITTLDELQRVVFAKEKEIINIVCPNCSEVIRTEFATCPYCGYAVVLNCPSCAREREAEWSHCPYCSMEFGKSIPLTEGLPAKEKFHVE